MVSKKCSRGSVVSRIGFGLANVLPVNPIAFFFGAISFDLSAITTVHVVLPLALVVSAISPDDPTVPVELVLFVLALIDVGAIKLA